MSSAPNSDNHAAHGSPSPQFTPHSPLRVLIVEDSEDDARLLKRQIEHGGFSIVCERVDNHESMSAALDRSPWDIIISDFAMPGFDGLSALSLVRERALDVPFIIVSGTIGEEIAVQSMKAGAHDYVMKNNRVRLVPAITRELRDAEVRREHRKAEEALRKAHAELEHRVKERTAELASANEHLKAEIDERKRAEEALQKAHDQLERRVEERTAALRSANEHLIEEIAERKRAEEDLFRSRQMLRTVLDTIPQRVFWKDFNSVYVGCNEAFAEDCGVADPAGIIGKSDYDMQPKAAADHHRADDLQVIKTGRPKLHVEEPQLKPDGSQIWLKTSKVPLHGKNGQVIGVLGTYEDITERKRLEEQFRQVQKMEAFGQLAAGVAHDFNNILTVIGSNISLVLTNDMSRAEQVDCLNQAFKAAGRAANLTRQLLTFSRRQPFQPASIDLNEIVASTTKMLRHLIGEHIALEAHFAPGETCVHADVGMIEQVLMNLAINSRDAMPNGGRLTIQTASVTVGEKEAQHRPKARAGSFVRLSVRDTGSGIAPEHLPHIFEPFFTTKEVGKGTGLGLATVFGIAEQHHGWIEVESQVNVGTTFHVWLPRLSRSSVSMVKSPAVSTVRGGDETILLVEDEISVREMMVAILKRHGYQVYAACSGVAALKVWEANSQEIDLLITDMVMPEGVGGRELADQLRSTRPSLKVIYCSGYTDEMLGKDSPLRMNVNFLEKPFDLHKFLLRVRDCLDGR